MTPFTVDQIEAMSEFVGGGRVDIIKWMEEQSGYRGCSRCGELEPRDVLASGLCPCCYTDQTGK